MQGTGDWCAHVTDRVVPLASVPSACRSKGRASHIIN